MTPKEKAEELVNKYKNILMQEDTDCGNEILCSLIAIKNAHIAVEEILIFMHKSINYPGLEHKYEWWLKVDIELNVM